MRRSYQPSDRYAWALVIAEALAAVAFLVVVVRPVLGERM